MEILLLDTTEKEGEDNKLYHYSTVENLNENFDSQVLHNQRGVLAAAMGATITLCGEALEAAHFTHTKVNMCSDSTTKNKSHIGYLQLYEVIFIFAFKQDRLVPNFIVKYYTEQISVLLLRLLGYPGKKLIHWDESHISTGDNDIALETRLNMLFTQICAIIEQDLAFRTSLQFAFNGKIPSTRFSIQAMVRLASLNLVSMSKESNAFISGMTCFYKYNLVYATIQLDIVSAISQWFLRSNIGNVFGQELNNKSTQDETSVWLIPLYDPHFAHHGIFPITSYLVEIRFSGSEYAVVGPDSDEMVAIYYLLELPAQRSENEMTIRSSLIRDLVIKLNHVPLIKSILKASFLPLESAIDDKLADYLPPKDQCRDTDWGDKIILCVCIDRLRHTMHKSQYPSIESITSQKECLANQLAIFLNQLEALYHQPNASMSNFRQYHSKENNAKNRLVRIDTKDALPINVGSISCMQDIHFTIPKLEELNLSQGLIFGLENARSHGAADGSPGNDKNSDSIFTTDFSIDKLINEKRNEFFRYIHQVVKRVSINSSQNKYACSDQYWIIIEFYETYDCIMMFPTSIPHVKLPWTPSAIRQCILQAIELMIQQQP